MKGTVRIPIETYECLRGHLEKANELFNSLLVSGSGASERKASRVPKKESKTRKISRYMEKIENQSKKK